MSHMRYMAQLGERGRIVLPAPLRRALGLEEGDQLLIDVDGENMRLSRARDVAQSARGLLQRDEADRDLVDELLAERRAEVQREAKPLAAR